MPEDRDEIPEEVTKTVLSGAAKKFCPSCGLEVEMRSRVCPNDGTDLTIPIALDPVFAGKYQFLGVIGSGGMGVIYKARQVILDKLVAIKTVHANFISEEAIRRFQIEGKAASSLKSPYIIAVYDFGVTTDSVPFMVMDFVDGVTLAEVFKTENVLSKDRFLAIFRQICLGLAHAHKRGVLHRDIKPSNIMLVKDDEGKDEIRIMDFGIAKLLTDSIGGTADLTKTGEAIGSPMYMSPEQVQGRKVDQRSDLYALGCVMYEALSGAPPFVGVTPFATMDMHLNRAPSSLSEASLGQKADTYLEKIVLKLLEKEPEDRFQTMDELINALASPSAQEANGEESPKISIHGIWVYPLAAVALVALGTCAWLLNERSIGHPVVPNSSSLTRRQSDEQSKPPIDQSFEDRPIKITTKDALDSLVRGQTAIDLTNLSSVADVKDADLEIFGENRVATDVNLNNLPIGDKGLDYLSHLSLVKLKVDNTRCSNFEAIKNMGSLKNLSASHTELSEAGIKNILTLKNLEELSIAATPVKANDVKRILRLPHLVRLCVQSCPALTEPQIESLRRTFSGTIMFAPTMSIEDERAQRLIDSSKRQFAQTDDYEASKNILLRAQSIEGITSWTRARIAYEQSLLQKKMNEAKRIQQSHVRN
ncbi:unnamed protein product [Sphagnum balticum]